jgi:hypothetical protein
MRRVKATRNLLLAVALIMPVSAAGAEDSPVREMMEVSGMVEQFSDLGENFRAGAMQSAGQSGLPTDLVDGLADIVVRHMDGEAFLQELEAGLELTLSADEAEAITAFYRSPLGERVKEAEVANSTSEALAEMEARRAEMRAVLDEDPTRLALATSIDEILLSSEMSATMAAAVARAMLVGAVEAAPAPVDQNALAAVEQKLTELHGQLVAGMRERLLTSFAFVYRELSNEELASYVEFLKTDPARAAYAAVYEVTGNFMSEQAELVGREFGTLIRQKKT